MKTHQLHYNKNKWNESSTSASFNNKNCQLVIVYGSSECITKPAIFNHLREVFPKANIVFSSTSGEIITDSVYDDTVVATAVYFEKATIRCSQINVKDHKNSYEAGKYLIKKLESTDLKSVFILSDGLHINGSELVTGFNQNNKYNVPVTGGLAGDGTKFGKTFVGLNEIPSEGKVVAVGFYGAGLQVAHGSFGGWDEFGPERTITRCDKNVLYEIDNKVALDLYKEYLGPYKEQLPASAFLFPLSMRLNGSDENLVRAVLGVNDKDKTMTLAGNLPEGSKVRLMKANFDNLIDGSSVAANNSLQMFNNPTPELAILISCVGRKIILEERTDEEIQAAKDIFGKKTAITGFYSYGEICPFNPGTTCEFHNQTMTITTFSEVA